MNHDDEIRSHLDKLNALSDLINSLERKFDEANCIFRETLKCSTDRLSSIAKTLGNKSIKQGRVYHAAKVSVEQSQTDCQRACVQFEQANKDHQNAKKLIQEVETKLRVIVGDSAAANGVISIPDVFSVESIDMQQLSFNEPNHPPGEELASSSSFEHLRNTCDNSFTERDQNHNDGAGSTIAQAKTSTSKASPDTRSLSTAQLATAQTKDQYDVNDAPAPSQSGILSNGDNNNCQNSKNASKLSEELNQALVKLVEAERKRGQSERQHMDRANKLITAQENLIKLEREYGPSIRRSQLYFDEAKQFNAKLNSVKADICRISEDIMAAKRAYARTLSELEQFSDDLHGKSGAKVH